MGADAVFDYRDAEVVAKIKDSAKAKGGYRHAVDCVAEGGTTRKVAAAMGEHGGTISVIMPPEEIDRSDVKVVFSIAYDLMGQVSGATSHSNPCRCTSGTNYSHDTVWSF